VLPERQRVHADSRHFDPSKARAWMERHGDVLPGGRFPYRVGTRLWVLMQDWRWEWLAPDAEVWRISIPAGWVWNLASIPWALEPIVGGDDQLGLACTLPHDVLHVFRGSLPGNWLHHWHKGVWRVESRCVPKTETDRCLFYEIALEDDVEPWRARLAWAGVSLNFVARWRWC
jgi:hypothetical protein